MGAESISHRLDREELLLATNVIEDLVDVIDQLPEQLDTMCELKACIEKVPA
jgi:hypothetical protein